MERCKIQIAGLENADIDKCKEKCDKNPNCNFFSISDDNICKIIQSCEEATRKSVTIPQTTYKKLRGNCNNKL